MTAPQTLTARQMLGHHFITLGTTELGIPDALWADLYGWGNDPALPNFPLTARLDGLKADLITAASKCDRSGGNAVTFEHHAPTAAHHLRRSRHTLRATAYANAVMIERIENTCTD